MSDINRKDDFLENEDYVEEVNPFAFEKEYTQPYTQNQIQQGAQKNAASNQPASRQQSARQPSNNTVRQNHAPVDRNKYAAQQNMNQNDQQEYEEDISMDEELQERRSYKRRRRVQSRFANFLKSLIYMMFVFAASLVVGFFVLSSAFDFIGVARPADEASVQFTIQDGDSVEDIALRLKENDVITQPKVFELFIRIVKPDTVFNPGTYTVKTNADYNSLIHQLQYVRKSNDIVRLTFPEGYTLDDIADALEKAGVCSKGDFIDCIQSADFSSNPLVAAIEENPDRYYRLEGYLFPDTYDFYQGEAVKSVVGKFLNALEKNITDAFNERAAEINMSMDEVLTLASIIQKEAAKQEDMFNVSAVFHNRLKSSDMRFLQSDTTLKYPSSKYDTSKYEGLPPGPICSPGVQAIEAALWPAEDQDALFFASDNNGDFYYAKTYSEHTENWEKIKKVNGQS